MGVLGQFNQGYARNWGLFPDTGEKIIFFRLGGINNQGLRVHIVVNMVCKGVRCC